jgi:hypothetical protein
VGAIHEIGQSIDIRFGSKADIGHAEGHVRFTPESGHHLSAFGCPLCATDSQKAALKDLTAASASADASAKKSLCADKSDLSTTPGRMAFAEKIAEIRLAGLKAIEPKLQAFYDSLDAKQKKAFDTGGRIGGIFDWWGKK